jgi:2-succinyl-5-enolpyruvyl-6-hydroxy-3-cyclohexene-1-carboxylate synthase
MTKSPPSHLSQTTPDLTSQQQRLQGVEAEDASNGEVGCGRDWGDKLPVYLATYGINVSDEGLRTLLREHLGHVLMERDFDSIVNQVTRFIEPLVVEAHTQSHSPKSVSWKAPNQTIPEHIPTEELKQRLVEDLGEVLTNLDLEQIIQFTHQVVHKAVLRPRHTWPDPIWVLTTQGRLYIAQADTVDRAIAKVREQYPNETEELEPVTVGGILAPDQAIALNKVSLNRCY